MKFSFFFKDLEKKLLDSKVCICLTHLVRNFLECLYHLRLLHQNCERSGGSTLPSHLVSQCVIPLWTNKKLFTDPLSRSVVKELTVNV